MQSMDAEEVAMLAEKMDENMLAWNLSKVLGKNWSCFI
jgi:hypothetical protein